VETNIDLKRGREKIIKKEEWSKEKSRTKKGGKKKGEKKKGEKKAFFECRRYFPLDILRTHKESEQEGVRETERERGRVRREGDVEVKLHSRSVNRRCHAAVCKY